MTAPQAPTWLIDLAGRARPKAESNVVPLIQLDQPQAIARATEYLATAEPAIEGAGGDTHTYVVAAKLKDFGVSQQTAVDLLLDHWNERNSPPWDPAELEQKVEHAYLYGRNAPGAADPMADFTIVETMTTPDTHTAAATAGTDDIFGPTTTRPALFYLKPSQIKAKLEQRHLVEDYLTPQAMAVMYGQSNTGKSFLSLDIGFHIATGRPWNGKQVEQGLVVYVAAEGGPGSHNRIAAYRKHYEMEQTNDFPLALVPCGVDLVKKGADTKPLIELIRQAEEDFGEKAVLVVIDTLARAMAGSNENASEDMSAFIGNVDHIRSATGAAVLIVHHSGKDDAKGARGHSSLRAATDTEFEVRVKGEPGSGRGLLKVTKQRDIEFENAAHFELAVVDLGTSAAGKAVSSCVVQMGVAAPGEDFDLAKLTPTARKVLEAWPAVLEEKGVDLEDPRVKDSRVFCKSLTVGDWRELVTSFCSGGKTARNSLIKETTSCLDKAGLFEEVNGFIMLRVGDQ